MIDIRTDSATRNRYVRNIVDAYRAATPDQLRRGLDWYPTAHQLAEMLADGDARKGAGVLAALSAQKSWDLNVQLAQRALDSGQPSGHFKDACAKASRIMAGEDPLTVLPGDLKTGQFYRCIADPTDPDAVVIDRHAHDIAVGEIYGNRNRGLSVPSRYALLAHCYREAAQQLGEVPSVVQAVTWVRHVERER